MKTEKPQGIKVFGIIQVIFSALTILSSGIGMSISLPLFGALIAKLPAEKIPEFSQLINISPDMFYFFAIFVILSSIINMALGWLGVIASVGVLITESWARKMLIYVAISILSFNIIGIIVEFAVGRYTSAFDIIIVLIEFGIKAIYYGLLISYFNKSEIKEIFTK